jgi:hypothetical protein
MTRSVNAREELAAALIGDAYNLVNRVESLTVTLQEAHRDMREAVWLLDSRIESSKQQVAEAVEQSKTAAIEEVRRKTGEFYGVSVVMQKKAMMEAAREIVSTELRPPVQELAQTLGRLVQRVTAGGVRATRGDCHRVGDPVGSARSRCRVRGFRRRFRQRPARRRPEQMRGLSVRPSQ